MRNTLLYRIIALGLFTLPALPAAVLAQTAPLSYHARSYVVDTGLHESRQGPTADVY